LSWPLQADDNAQAWLEKMAHAMANLNYQISFVLMAADSPSEPYLWRHAIIDEVEYVHLSMLNGPGREVVRVGNQVSYFEPNIPSYTLASDVINGPLPNQLIRHPLSLLDAYSFVLVGRSRVSGRAAQQIRIISQDKSRYSYNLWLDQETGLLLKLDMQELNGRVLEQVQVVAFNVSAEPDPYFQRIEFERLPPISRSNEREVQHNWQINRLPKGMQVVKMDVHRLPGTDQLVEYMMLSDGLVDVSVYLQRVNGHAAERGALRYQTETLVTLQRDSLAVTIIGKLPAETAGAIASSISLQPAR